jgi:hypothetical protein
MLLDVAPLKYRTGEKEELVVCWPFRWSIIIERRLTANACDEEPPAPENVCCDGQ